MGKFDINEEWKNYCTARKIPYDQVGDLTIIKEARRAFYAGFAAMIIVVGKISEEEEEKVVDATEEVHDLQSQVLTFLAEDYNIIPRN